MLSSVWLQEGEKKGVKGKGRGWLKHMKFVLIQIHASRRHTFAKILTESHMPLITYTFSILCSHHPILEMNIGMK